MGSIIGLLYAAGYSPDQIYDICCKVPLPSLFEMTMPINSGLLDTQKFISYASKFIPANTQIENLDIPIMIICEDLISKRSILISEGDFLQVLQASFALPAYFDNVKYKDHLLVDGGIADIVPLDIAYKYGNKNIVSTTFYNVDFLNLENPLTNLNVSFDIGKRRQGIKEIKEHPEAVWIRCDVEDISFMEFSKIDYVTKKGYESAKETKNQIQNLVSNGHSELTPTILQKRKAQAKLIKTEQDKFLLYNHVDSLQFANTIGLKSWTSSLDSDYFFLSNSFGTGIGDDIKWKNFELKTNAGFETSISSNGWVYPGANASIAFFFNKLKFSITGDYVFPFDTSKINEASLYTTQYIGYNFKNTNAIKLNLIETTEYIADNSNLRHSYWNKDGGISSLIFNAEITNTNNTLKFDTGPQFVWQNSGITPLYFGKISNKTFIFGSSFFVKPSVTTRLTFNHSDSVFLSSHDGYYTNNSDFLTYGVPGYDTENKKNHLFIAGFETGYVNNQTPSFGELILFDSLSISAFTNFIWFNLYDTIIPDANYGIKLSTNSSFIGLSKLATEIIVSYDTSDKSIYLGLNINN